MTERVEIIWYGKDGRVVQAISTSLSIEKTIPLMERLRKVVLEVWAGEERRIGR